MSLQLPGQAAPASGFEAPLEMLSACHLRVERQCVTLRRLVAHLLGRDPDDEARAAVAAVLRYFDTAAKDHHADEETDLFPALIESMAGSDAVCIRELIDSLTLDHRALGSRFIRLYERHIAREEAELLPMVSRLLGADSLNEIGKSMRERRGIASFD